MIYEVSTYSVGWVQALCLTNRM